MKKLSEVVKDINKKADKEIAFVADDQSRTKVEAISTGLLPLDMAIGIGGIPRGKIIELHGLQSSGKSSLCLAIVSQFQKLGISCAYVDAEYSFDAKHATSLGVSPEKLLLIQPDCGEEAFEAMERLIKDKAAQLIIVDSVSALVPKPTAEAEYGKVTIGAQAKLMANGLQKIIGPTAKNGAIIIFINQLRMNIMGGQYDPYIIAGGMALKFYSSVMLELKKEKAIMSGDKWIGYNLRIRVKKNKVALPGGECDVQLIFNEGFTGEGDLISLGLEKGVLERRGTTYWHRETKIGVGAEKARIYLKENPDFREELKTLLYGSTETKES